VAPPPRWLIVYTCKVPAVVEGYKKIRVALNEINDWINDCICHHKILPSQILDEACFFCKPRNDGWVGGWFFCSIFHCCHDFRVLAFPPTFPGASFTFSHLAPFYLDHAPMIIPSSHSHRTSKELPEDEEDLFDLKLLGATLPSNAVLAPPSSAHVLRPLCSASHPMATISAPPVHLALWCSPSRKVTYFPHRIVLLISLLGCCSGATI